MAVTVATATTAAAPNEPVNCPADEDHSEFGGKENVRIWSYSETFSFDGGSIFKDSGLSIRCIKD